MLGEMALGLADRVHAKVKDTGSQNRIGLSGIEHVHHVIEISRAATGNDRDADCGRNRS